MPLGLRMNHEDIPNHIYIPLFPIAVRLDRDGYPRTSF